MSSIGLFDRDFLDRSDGVRYNLQLMKLAAYHRRKRDLVSLITDPSRAPYYTKIYYRQNDPELSFPKELSARDNVDIGGYAINPVYEPLADEIENILPATDIYDKAASRLKLNSVQTQQLKSQNSVHLQLTADGSTISDFSWEQARMQKHLGLPRNIILHDINIAPYEKQIPDFIQTYMSHIDNNARYLLLFQYPLVMQKETILQLAKWGIAAWSAQIFVDGYLDMAEARDFYSAPYLSYEGTKRVVFQLPNASTYRAQCALFAQAMEDTLWAQAHRKYYNFNVPSFSPGLDMLFYELPYWTRYNSSVKKTLSYKDYLWKDIQEGFSKAIVAWRELEKAERAATQIQTLKLVDPKDLKEGKRLL